MACGFGTAANQGEGGGWPLICKDSSGTLLWIKPATLLASYHCQNQLGGDPIMIMHKLFMPTIVALGLALGVPSLAAEPHAHGGPATIELRLNDGKKWQTDDVLRSGMSQIRTAVAESLAPIHQNTFMPAQYDTLAGRIQAQVDYVVGNCKLPEEADQQLHLVLEQIIDGVAEMKGTTGRDQGTVKIVRALAQYGEYFDHAGWRPLVD
jgi:hypothetical protein